MQMPWAVMLGGRFYLFTAHLCLNIIQWHPYINHPMHQSVISVRQKRDESREEGQF